MPIAFKRLIENFMVRLKPIVKSTMVMKNMKCGDRQKCLKVLHRMMWIIQSWNQ